MMVTDSGNRHYSKSSFLPVPPIDGKVHAHLPVNQMQRRKKRVIKLVTM
jgi:hypothetical protein